MIGIGGFLLSNDYHVAFTWAKAYYSFPLIVGVSFPLLAGSFPLNEKVPRLWWLLLSTIYVAIAAPVLFVHSFVTERLVYHDWGKEILLNKFDYLLYSVLLLAGLISGLLHMFLKSEQLRGVAKLQTQFFFVGFLLTSVFGVFFNMILPWFGNYQLIWLGPLFTSAFASTVGYSIIKHRMFDIRVALARATAYIISIAVLSSVFGFVVFGFAEFAFHLHIAVSAQMAISLATGIAALAFYRIKAVFDKLTNAIFYKDAYDPQLLLDQVSRALVATIGLEKTLKNIATIVTGSLKSEYCVFGIKETRFQDQRIIGTDYRTFAAKDIAKVRSITPRLGENVIVVDDLPADQGILKQVLVKNGIAILARIAPVSKTPVEGLGYIVLGAKKSGNPYNSQDIRMLNLLSNELLIAIQNALHFEEIQQFNTTLTAEVDQATRKLRRTNQRLVELDETKDDFISMASHQLRTPLTSVKGYLSMVLEGDAGKLNETQRKMLGQAFTSSQRMVFLITDLLNVSRLKTGKFVIDAAPIDLSALIQGEIAQLVETAQAKDLELTYQKPATFPKLMLDETKTRQVIMNYIDNAIYYTPSGGHIRIELLEKPATVELRVVDDGIGVPKGEQHHLFTKFYRAANARKARPDGTGLGLFMAKKVIIAEGGSVIFESQENKGSTFGFVLSKSKLRVPIGMEPRLSTGSSQVQQKETAGVTVR